jgi:hypothetical protein
MQGELTPPAPHILSNLLPVITSEAAGRGDASTPSKANTIIA